MLRSKCVWNRLAAVGICAALFWTSPGLECYRLAAQGFGKTGAGAPEIPRITQAPAGLGGPAFSGPATALSGKPGDLSVPSAPPQAPDGDYASGAAGKEVIPLPAAPLGVSRLSRPGPRNFPLRRFLEGAGSSPAAPVRRVFARMLERLAGPSALRRLPAKSAADAVRGAGEREFAARVGVAAPADSDSLLDPDARAQSGVPRPAALHRASVAARAARGLPSVETVRAWARAPQARAAAPGGNYAPGTAGKEVHPLPAAPGGNYAPGTAGKEVHPLPAARPQRRSVLFPVPWTAAALLPWIYPWFSAMSSMPAAISPLIGYLFMVAEVVSLPLLAYTVVEFVYWARTVLTARVVSDEQFYRVLTSKLYRMGVHVSVVSALIGHAPGAGTIKPLRVLAPKLVRPDFSWSPRRWKVLAPAWARFLKDAAVALSRYARATFSFGVSFGNVFLRPEVVLLPDWYLGWILKHEVHHYFHPHPDPDWDTSDARPRWMRSIARILWAFTSEISSRFHEFWSGWLRNRRIPVLERAIQETGWYFPASSNFQALLVRPEKDDPAFADWYDSVVYAKLSRGHAVLERSNATSANLVGYLTSGSGPDDGSGSRVAVSAEHRNRYRVVVVPSDGLTIPARASLEEKRLNLGLSKLDPLYQASQGRRVARTDGREASASDKELELLVKEAQRLQRRGVQPGDIAYRKIERALSDLWFNASQTFLRNIRLVDTISAAYQSLDDGGTVFFPWREQDAGLETVRKLLLYWRSEDGGRFSVRRVDLPEGGYVLAARKEANVFLWFKAQEGTVIAASQRDVLGNYEFSDETRALLGERGYSDAEIELIRGRRSAAQYAAFLRAGYSKEQVDLLVKIGAKVYGVFGKDGGKNHLFVSIPRNQVSAVQKYAERSGIRIHRTVGGFQTSLRESIPLHHFPSVWSGGSTGEGYRLAVEDTGVDASHPYLLGRVSYVDIARSGSGDPRAQRRVPLANITPSLFGDPQVHGTHVTGIINANGPQHKGGAPAAHVRVENVFPGNGEGAVDGILMEGALDAKEWGANQINLSLGLLGPVDAELAEWYSWLAQEYGIFVAAAAGNSGPFDESLSLPGVGRYVFNAGSVTKKKKISFFTGVGFARYKNSYLEWMEFGPKGVLVGGDVDGRNADPFVWGVESTKSKDGPPSDSDSPSRLETRMSGTSQSSPHAAAVAAHGKSAADKALKLETPADREAARSNGTAAQKFYLANAVFSIMMIMMRSAEDLKVPVVFQGAGFIDAAATVRSANDAFRQDTRLERLLRGAGLKKDAPLVPAHEYIERLKEVWDVQKQVHDQTQEAGRAAEESGLNRAQAKAAAAQRLQEVLRDPARNLLPRMLELLDHPVWLVRMYAAFALYNFRAPEAATALAKHALEDADGRVRQVAALALAKISTQAALNFMLDGAQRSVLDSVRAADARLREAVANPKRAMDVRMFAAHALAQHGDLSGIGVLAEGSRSGVFEERFTAAWLLGQLGRRATPEAAAALSEPLRREPEPIVQHIAAAAVGNLAVSNAAVLIPPPQAPDAVSSLLAVANLEVADRKDMAFISTAVQVFGRMRRIVELTTWMRREGAVRSAIEKFIAENKGSAASDSPLGAMVRMLAQIINVPIELPEMSVNSQGVGIPGIDPNMGPIHLLVKVPAKSVAALSFKDFRIPGPEKASPADLDRRASEAGEVWKALGIDPGLMRYHEVELQAVLPASRMLRIGVPDHRVRVLSAKLESRGFEVHRSLPVYRAASRGSGAYAPPGVAVFVLGDGTEDGDGTFVRVPVLGVNGGTTADVVTGIESIQNEHPDPLRRPAIIEARLQSAEGPDGPLSRASTQLALKNYIVVAPKGEEPPEGPLPTAPSVAPLVQSDAPGLLAAWIEELSRTMGARFGGLPDGYGLWLQRLSGRNAEEGVQAIRDALRSPEKMKAQAAALIGRARKQYGISAPRPGQTSPWVGPLVSVTRRLWPGGGVKPFALDWVRSFENRKRSAQPEALAGASPQAPSRDLHISSEERAALGDLEAWLSEQKSIALERLFDNISPPGAAPGAVAASLSRENPNYFYHWVRDGAKAMSVVVRLYGKEQNAVKKQEYFDLLVRYVDFVRRFEMRWLGEPKFEMDGRKFEGPWGRPQDDGPASVVAEALGDFALVLVAEGKEDFVREHLYDPRRTTILREHLDYVAKRWANVSFDAWEEVLGLHFYAGMIERKALIRGAELARRLGHPNSGNYYETQGRMLEQQIERFWKPDQEVVVRLENGDALNLGEGIIVPTLNRTDGVDYKHSGVDSITLFGVIDGGLSDGFFTVTDERVLATVKKQEEAFQQLYAINHNGVPGIAIGRYPEDRYSHDPNVQKGNGWVIATLKFAQFYYLAAQAYLKEGGIEITHSNLFFFEGLSPAYRDILAPGMRIESSIDLFGDIVGAMREAGDSYMARVRFHKNGDGSLSEQIHRDTGFMVSARDLSWNYAVFLQTAWAREALIAKMSAGSQILPAQPAFAAPLTLETGATSPRAPPEVITQFSWRDPRIFSFLMGTLTTQFANDVLKTLFAILLTKTFASSPLALSVVLGTAMLLEAFGNWLGGWLSDRRSSTSVTIGFSFLRVLALLPLALAVGGVLGGGLGASLLATVMLLNALVGGVADASRNVVMPNMTGADNRFYKSLSTAHQTVIAVGATLGPALVGVFHRLIAVLGELPVFLIAPAALMISTVFFIKLPRYRPAPRKENLSVLRVIREERWIGYALILGSLMSLYPLVSILAAEFAKNVLPIAGAVSWLGSSDAIAAWIVTSYGIGFGLATLVYQRWKDTIRLPFALRLAALGALVWGLGWLAPSFWLSVAGTFLFAFGGFIGRQDLDAKIKKLARQEVIGTVTGHARLWSKLTSTAMQYSIPLILAASINRWVGFWWIAAVFAVIAALQVALIPKLMTILPKRHS